MSGLRRVVAIISILAAFLIPSTPAVAAPTRHLFVVWLDGTTLGDWSAPGLPNFQALLKGGAIALLATRTADEIADLRSMRASAAVSFSAGSEAAGDPRTGKPITVTGVTPGLLGDALARAGYSTGFRESIGSIDHNAALALARSDGVLPRYEDPRERALLHVPDAELVDLGGQPLKQADEFLGLIQRGMSPSDLLVVVSGSTSVARQRQGIRLSAVAVQGPGFGPGLLTSGTTRRDGVVTLTDLAPTIVAALGLPPLPGADGRAATVKPTSNGVPKLLALERDLIRASLDRRPLTRWTLVAAMVLILIALAVVWFAGPALKTNMPRTNRHRPSGARDWLATLLVASAATPLALYVNGAFHPSSTGVAGIEAVAVALGVALITRATVGLTGSLVVVLGLTALVPLVDLLIGTPLAIRSPLAFQVAGGGRFYGVDDGVLGVVVGAEVFAAALIVERVRGAGRWVAIVFAASVWLLGAPSFGSKFGAALTAVPAFGVLAVAIGGKRFTRASIAAIAIATIAVTGLLIGVDALRTPAAQSHVARAVEGRSSVGGILSRKIHAQWTITAHTIWTPAIILFAGAIALVIWRRRDLFARALESHTLLRPALLAALVGGIAGFMFNDGGVLTTAPIAMFASTVVFAALLAPG